jgi:hypothetical protein
VPNWRKEDSMSSKWNHSMCVICWYEKNPEREPHVITDADEDTCCFCGLKSKAGIYVREDPKDLRCKGEHDDE